MNKKMGVIAMNCFHEDMALQHCCCNHGHIAAIDTRQNWSCQSSIKNGGLVNETTPTLRTQWLLMYIGGGCIFFHISVSTVGLGGKIFMENINSNYNEVTLHVHHVVIREKGRKGSRKRKKEND